MNSSMAFAVFSSIFKNNLDHLFEIAYDFLLLSFTHGRIQFLLRLPSKYTACKSFLI